jgi:uncharacterized spore protein YtfJ
MEFQKAISGATDSITVKRVFGEAYERNGVMVIPAAEVMGGGGGGTGEGPDGTGGGGGFGVRARPAGVYVVRGEEVSWRPAVDLNRVVLGCQLLGLAAIFLTYRRLRRRK